MADSPSERAAQLHALFRSRIGHPASAALCTQVCKPPRPPYEYTTTVGMPGGQQGTTLCTSTVERRTLATQETGHLQVRVASSWGSASLPSLETQPCMIAARRPIKRSSAVAISREKQPNWDRPCEPATPQYSVRPVAMSRCRSSLSTCKVHVRRRAAPGAVIGCVWVRGWRAPYSAKRGHACKATLLTAVRVQ